MGAGGGLGLGQPEIFNTDQGAQVADGGFTGLLESRGGAASIDGRGRVFGNIFTERLWRSIKCEEVYLKDYGSPQEARKGLAAYFRFCNEERLHQSLGYRTRRKCISRRRGPEQSMWLS